MLNYVNLLSKPRSRRDSRIRRSWLVVVLLGLTPGANGVALAGQQTTLSPVSYSVQRGRASDQGVEVLATENQRGDTDDWSGYLEFYSAGIGFHATFEFETPIDFVGKALDTGELRVNFKGPPKEYQAWNFYAFNYRTSHWVPVMNNEQVADWQWTVISSNFRGHAGDYIDLLGRMKISILSRKADDDVNIDSMQITLNAIDTSPVSTPSNPATPVEDTSAPAAEQTPPVSETPEPVAEQTPPVSETPEPVAEQTPAVSETPEPVAEQTPAVSETPEPVAEQTPPVSETPEPVAEQTPPVSETPEPVAEETPPVVVTTPPTRSGNIWQAKPGTSWQIQFTGNRDTSYDVEMYDLDLFDTPTSVIKQLRNQGRAVICYFSAGTWENWRSDAGQFPNSVLGANLADWPGERWLDVSNINALAPIMRARLDLAAEKGCDGVDPDNMDGYSNPNGFSSQRLNAADQLAYNKWLADEAHARGLAIGLKNDLGQVKQLEPHFDFAINESCNQYNECQMLEPFVSAGKAVFGIEYSGNRGTICSRMNAFDFDFIFKSRSLDAKREACR